MTAPAVTPALNDDTAAAPAPRPTRGDIAEAWWRALAHPKRGDPATLARLRRCRAPGDAATVPAAVALARRLGALPSDRLTDARVDVALDLARVLAHIRENTDERPMRAAGWERLPRDRKAMDGAAKQPRLAEARFQRLLRVGPGQEQTTAFIRLVALLGRTVNVRILARSFLDWSHPDYGPEVRRRWAFDYYAASVAAPPDTASHSSPDDEDDTE